MSKIAVIALSSLLSFAAQADHLSSFDDVAKAIAQGKRITFVLDLSKCTSDKPQPIIGSITPNAILLINNNRITASDRHFTMNNPAAPNSAVFDYTKYNITADNNVSIKTMTINASNYDLLASYQVDCQLNKGFSVFN